MHISLPTTLDHSELKKLINTNFRESFTAQIRQCHFIWNRTQYVSLPAVVMILNWSSKLVDVGKSVTWQFLDPMAFSAELDALRALTREILGEEKYGIVDTSIRDMKTKIRLGSLKRKQYSERFQQIIKETRGENARFPEQIGVWLEHEKLPFDQMNLCGYLDRYELFQRAEECGIDLLPPPAKMIKFVSDRNPKTASLELKSILSSAQVGMLADNLADPGELGRVLGDYAHLDIARGGALSQILVTELGKNVAEHSNASAAWLCTRIVGLDSLRQQADGDPALASFLKRDAAFLEVIVSDNGDGLTYELGNSLIDDQRELVRAKYGNVELTSAKNVIDYAFDRLASRKRDIARLLLYESERDYGELEVASGLYWIWNLVRSHHGVLIVHTADVYGWYDFMDAGEGAEWILTPLKVDRGTGPTCGTTIRICLPLTVPVATASFRSIQPASTQAVNLRETLTKVVWIGDLTNELLRLPATRKYKKSRLQNQNVLPGFRDLDLGNQIVQSDHLLGKLMGEHSGLKDGGILVLDLSGLLFHWPTKDVAPLCHFFLEMNYTSTLGRTAVVLWNVPHSDREMFELGIELINSRAAKLTSVRRLAMLFYDDETVRMFSGWHEAEILISRLYNQSDLDLDEMGLQDLPPEDQRKFEKLLIENPHIFEKTGRSRFRLRTWPLQIRADVWAAGIQWFDRILNLDVNSGGVHRRPRQTKYFRLPSTGKLVDQFYQFRGLLSNFEACSRIAWHVAEIIRFVIKPFQDDGQSSSRPQQNDLYLVSVSRSTMPLVDHLYEHYFHDTHGFNIKVLVQSSIEELEAVGSTVNGNAILITDVISSGALCERIFRALGGVKWLGIVTLVDAREDAMAGDKTEIAFNLPVHHPPTISDTQVYALALRAVGKMDPDLSNPEPSEAIDEINVSPTEAPDLAGSAEASFWQYVERKHDSLRVGHFRGEYHHYLYEVDMAGLLEAPNPSESGGILIDFILDSVEEKLDALAVGRSNLVIMHPPVQSSHAERIAKALQRRSGAVYRHILHKDNFGGHWRFSPFVEHGVPLDGSTLILIDDGTNSGETLMGLLEAGTALGKPKNVIAYIGITRMPPHKNAIFRKIHKIANVSGTIDVRFALELNIPVYTLANCPICRFRNYLTRIEEISPLLSFWASELKLATRGSNPFNNGESDTDGVAPLSKLSNTVWAVASPISATRLREALEKMEFDSRSHELLSSEIKQILDNKEGGPDRDPLLDLGFVISSEPELASATIFVQHYFQLADTALNRLKTCNEDEALSFIGLAFQFLMQRKLRVASSPSIDPWFFLFARSTLSIKLIATVITFLVTQTLSERETESEGMRTALCAEWLIGLHGLLQIEVTEHSALVKSMSYLYVREAIELLHGNNRRVDVRKPVDAENDLYEMIDESSRSLWRHSSTRMKGYLRILVDWKQDMNEDPSGIYAVVHKLILIFSDLREIQYRLRIIEEECRQTIGELPDANLYWNSPNLEGAVDRFLVALGALTREIESENRALSLIDATKHIDTLCEVWDGQLAGLLNSAYERIFPTLYTVTIAEVERFESITGLPRGMYSGVRVAHGLKDARVFFPIILLSRFFDVALQNLRTAAFATWNESQIKEHAEVSIEIVGEVQMDESFHLILRIFDNGPMYSTKTPSTDGEHRGLADVKRMAIHFGAELKRAKPTGDGRTVVELRLKQRMAKR